MKVPGFGSSFWLFIPDLFDLLLNRKVKTQLIRDVTISSPMLHLYVVSHDVTVFDELC
jgi:hypothetical protein